jgi:formiminotetrahydrofolate cyclodeaminase
VADVLFGTVTAAGPAAAQVGSAAASIVREAARDVGDSTSAAQASALAARLARLAVDDERALMAARAKLPSGDPAEPDERRDFALGRALDDAAAVPLAIAEACADVVDLAAALAPSVTTAFAGDVEGARLLAAGAARAAAHLVEINLGVAPGDPRLARAQAAARR